MVVVEGGGGGWRWRVVVEGGSVGRFLLVVVFPANALERATQCGDHHEYELMTNILYHHTTHLWVKSDSWLHSIHSHELIY